MRLLRPAALRQEARRREHGAVRAVRFRAVRGGLPPLPLAVTHRRAPLQKTDNGEFTPVKDPQRAPSARAWKVRIVDEATSASKPS